MISKCSTPKFERPAGLIMTAKSTGDLMNAKVGPRIQCRKMSHDLTCDFLTPTMQFLDVGYVCILVSVERERSRKKHRERTPDGSDSEEEPLQKIAERRVERRVNREERSLQAYKDEALKKLAQKKTGAGSSGSSLISEPTNKKPSAIVSPSKRKLSVDDPEIG